MYITGNPDGLPRSLDIVLGCDECFVHVASPEKEFRHKSMEVKQKVEEHGFRSQMLARVTVFSFLHKQRYLTCNLDHFLVPSIAATKMEIKIYFYDSKHDILLGRGKNLFIEISETEIQPPNYKAILAMWLVVNYKFLCSGPPELLLKVPKARFCEHAVSCIDMYEKEL